jgi:hypothetical protein
MPRSFKEECIQDDDDNDDEIEQPHNSSFYSGIISYETIKTKIVEYGTPLIDLAGIYIVWILLHYICSHLYVSWCAPLTIIGFILSPFVALAPHCQAFRWVILNGSNSITAMWFTFGTWIAKKIVL